MNVLVIIDMQNDFVSGALGTPEAVAIVPQVAKKLASYRERGAPVVFTRDTHDEAYSQTREGRAQPVVHCQRGSVGWQIIDQLSVGDSPVVDKHAYGSLALPSVIERLDGVDGIEVVGVCTDMCVITNALILKSAFPEWPLTVDASCCAGGTPAGHQTALAAMKTCRVLVVNE